MAFEQVSRVIRAACGRSARSQARETPVVRRLVLPASQQNRSHATFRRAPAPKGTILFNAAPQAAARSLLVAECTYRRQDGAQSNRAED
jgi:hypothetical protein